MPIIIPGANYDYGKVLADVSMRQQALAQESALAQQRMAEALDQRRQQAYQYEQDLGLRKRAMENALKQQAFENQQQLEGADYRRKIDQRSFETDADRYAKDYALRKQQLDEQVQARKDTLEEQKRQHNLEAKRFDEDRATREKLAGIAAEDRIAAQRDKEQQRQLQALQFQIQARQRELERIQGLYNTNPALVNPDREAQLRSEIQSLERQVGSAMGVSDIGNAAVDNRDMLAEAKARQQEALARQQEDMAAKRQAEQRKIAAQQLDAEDSLRRSVLEDKRGGRAATAESFIDSKIAQLSEQGLRVTPETRQKILEGIPNYKIIKDLSAQAEAAGSPAAAADMYNQALAGLDAPTQLVDPKSGRPIMVYNPTTRTNEPKQGTYADQLRLEGGDPAELRQVFSARRDALAKQVGTPADTPPADIPKRRWTDAERKAWEKKRAKELPLTAGIFGSRDPVTGWTLDESMYKANPATMIPYWLYRGVNALSGGE
jgi:hypothetical protein